MMRKPQMHGAWGKGQGNPVFHAPCTLPLAPARGFVLPAAIFLLVVLGGLAGWMMQLTQATHAQDALAIEGERAFRAAEAGLEAGIYAASVQNTCANQNITFSGALSRFTASISCTAHSADEAGVTIDFHEILSIACNQPVDGACPNAEPTLPEYAERRMRAVVEGG
jgi:MSHA biogenesis protein MshP